MASALARGGRQEFNFMFFCHFDRPVSLILNFIAQKLGEGGNAELELELVSSNHCFQANFQEFYMFSSKSCWNFSVFLYLNTKFGKVGLCPACETCEIPFYRTAFLRFWKRLESWLE